MYSLSKLNLSILLVVASITSIASEDIFELTGNLTQGGLAYGQVAPGSKVRVDEYWVRVSSEGEFIIGFGRDYPRQASMEIHSVNGSKSTHRLNVTSRKYSTQRINGLPDKKVTPDKEDLKRIHKENKNISKARSLNDDRMDFRSGFIWPTHGPISGVYGSRRILNGKARQPHFGIDIAVPTGTPVMAPAAGIVTYVNTDMYFSGGTLVLDHGHNLSSSFLHLSKILVDIGDRVEQGQTIALVGATGRVTGAHLDWRMNWRRQRLDPGLLVGKMPVQE